jgi:hypothetical protein
MSRASLRYLWINDKEQNVFKSLIAGNVRGISGGAATVKTARTKPTAVVQPKVLK